MVRLLEEDREDFAVRLSDLRKLEDVGIEDANIARKRVGSILGVESWPHCSIARMSRFSCSCTWLALKKWAHRKSAGNSLIFHTRTDFRNIVKEKHLELILCSRCFLYDSRNGSPSRERGKFLREYLNGYLVSFQRFAQLCGMGKSSA